MKKASAKKLIIPFLIAVLLLFSLPVNAAEINDSVQTVSASVTSGAQGYVNDDGVNLRSGAGTSYAVVTVMPYNTEFTFDDATLYNGEWYKITLTDGTKGYIYYEYASVKESQNDKVIGSGYINASDVNMRSGAGTGYSVITTLDYGTALTAISKSGDWYYVELDGGIKGYVYADYVTIKSDEPQRKGLSKTSLTMYRGNHSSLYVNGANSVSYSSSNSSVVSVTSDGLLYANATGSAVITARYGGVSESCYVTVSSGSYVGISDSTVSINKDKSVFLTTDSYVDWKTSNPNVATVEDGIVYAKNEGVAVISAETSYGAGTCIVTVTKTAPVRFVYASPNSAPLNSLVTLNAITDNTKRGLYFVITNGTKSYTLHADSIQKEGNHYIWSAGVVLDSSGKWSYTAYSLAENENSYKTVEYDADGEVFVTSSTDTTTAVLGERRASDDIISLIANYEGFLPNVTPDYITGDATLGYGKVVWSGEQFYNNLTRTEAYAYLCQTVNSGGYTTRVNRFLLTNNVKCNQQQFDALVCFTYNVGAYAIDNDSDLSDVLLNTTALPSQSPATDVQGYVSGDGVNLRSGASTSYSVVTVMSYGTSFTFADGNLYNDNWYKIRLTDGTVGYIYSDYASVVSASRSLDNVSKSAFARNFFAYHHAAGGCYEGLLYRRVDEAEVFFYGDYIRDGYDNKYGFSYTCASNPSFGL